MASAIIAILGVLIGGGLIIGGNIQNNSASQVDDSMPSYSLSTNINDAIQQGNEWMNKTKSKNESSFAGHTMIGFGVFILFGSLMISGAIFMFAKRREILAFQVQQVAPVAKEGVEKATPVVGKAAGDIAKEIAKGIAEGKEEGASNKKPTEQ